jgi:hypothetical protein
MDAPLIDLDADPGNLSTLLVRTDRRTRVEIDGDPNDDGVWFRVPKRWLALFPDLVRSELFMAITLASFANQAWLAWPSNALLQSTTRLSKSAMSEALAGLRDRGFITRRRIRTKGRVFKSWLLGLTGNEESAVPIVRRSLFSALDPTIDRTEKSAPAGAERPLGRTTEQTKEQNVDDDVVLARLVAEGFEPDDARALMGRCGAEKVAQALGQADGMERDAGPAGKPFKLGRFRFLAWLLNNPSAIKPDPRIAEEKKAEARKAVNARKAKAIETVRGMPDAELGVWWDKAVANAVDPEQARRFQRNPWGNAELALAILDLIEAEAAVKGGCGNG